MFICDDGCLLNSFRIDYFCFVFVVDVDAVEVTIADAIIAAVLVAMMFWWRQWPIELASILDVC